jgi:trimeric autotransporter adhesin
MKHVTFHLPSFLRRVRIHGGEFDSSARAMNRVNGKGSLMSYERAVLVQAESRIVRGSTFERKQMSTSIKRIALVAVAALGLGVMSVAPSTATTNADTLTLSAATAAQLTGETATATSAVATLSYLADSAADSMTVTVSLVSAPATSVALPRLLLMETATAVVRETVTAVATQLGSTSGIAANSPVFVIPAGTPPVNAIAKFRVYLNAPTVAGTYVVRVTPAVSGVGTLNATAQNLTITVTAAPADNKVAATATSIISAGETNSATADVTVTSTRTQATTASATTAAATIKVGLLNSSGLAANESFTATIAGPGILGAYTAGSGDATLDEGSPSARVLMVKNGDVVQVYPDGASGVATITISSLLGVVLATETVTFFGAATTITATVKKPVLGGTTDTTGVLEVTVKDSAGVSVSDLANKIGVVSSDITKIATNYTPTSTYSATTGTYLVNVRPVAPGSANLTVTTKASATATTGIDAAAAVAVRVGGGKDKLDGLTVATDKTSYAPGELVTLTVTPLDAAGLILGDETHTVFTSTGILSSHSVTSPEGTSFSLGQASAQDGGLAGTGTKLGVATYKFYAPNIEGDMTLSWTRSTEFVTAANDSLTGKITIAVSSPGTAAATDAANEATDAANAATDAALAAAEAADAATSAAQEASDAVAALSESVTKLIAGLQAQIKSLAAVVAKIAKKVKA